MKFIADLYEVFLDSKGVNTDTRALAPGEIFWALVGERFDGNTFVEQALDNGAKAVVCSDPSKGGLKGVWVVRDTLEALQQFATYHRRKLNYPILALTGSNGKTTTKELVTTALSAGLSVQCTKGNFNNHIGVPLTLLSLPQDLDIAVVEMGANHQKEIELLCQIAEPDMGLITNIGMAHLEGFGGLLGVRKGKGEMYDWLKAFEGTIFCNTSQQFLEEMAGDYKKTVKYNEANLLIGSDVYSVEPILGHFCGVKIRHRDGNFEIHTRLVGSYNYGNILTALVVGLYMENSLEAVCAKLNGFGLDMNRSQLIEANGVEYILDAYNANPTSMHAALESFSERPGKKGVVIGEMLELGDESAYRHQLLLDELERSNFEFVVLVGEAFQEFKENSDYLFFENVQSALSIKTQLEGAVNTCLIKGSRKNALERWLAVQ